MNPDTTPGELVVTLGHSTPVAVVVGDKAGQALAEAARELNSIRLVAYVGTKGVRNEWHCRLV